MWIYKGNVFTEDSIGEYVGFVYIINNHTSGKKYVGKKLFTKSKIYQKNKKKKRKRVPSDWIDYTGSNKLLNEAVTKGDVIQKEILHLCKTKGWMSYLEAQEILNRGALQSDEYYNEWITIKIYRSHL